MRIICVDLGTTSTKAALFDEKLNLIAETSVENTLYAQQMGWQELDADEVLRGTVSIISELAQKANGSVDGICFSSMMHSLIALDEHDRPLTGVMLWNDLRAQPYVELARIRGEGLLQYQRTGTPCHPMSPAYKIAWMRAEQPALYEHAARYVSIKEYVMFHLLEHWVADYSIASASGLMNIYSLEWDAETLEGLGLHPDQFSPLVDTTEVVGGLTVAAAEAVGLYEGTPVVIGASDGCLANLGGGAIRSGHAALTIGTSGAVRVSVDHPVLHPNGNVFCYYLSEDCYIAGGSINNGGIAFRWLRDHMENKQFSYEQLNELIADVPAGADGILFLPYLYGERAPYWDARLRATFLGLSGAHTHAHMARAVIEGVSFALKDVLDSVREMVGTITQVQADGGFSVSKEWVATLADVLGMPLTIGKGIQGPSIGAAMMGWKGLGELPSLTAGVALLQPGEGIPMRAQNSNLYRQLFMIYRQAVECTQPVLHALADYQARVE